MLTRCPHCQTTFRVTEDHLQQAGGKVRCGQCQEIFDGRAHLIADDGTPLTAEPEAREESSNAPEQAFADADMEFIDLSAFPAPAETSKTDTRTYTTQEPHADEASDDGFNDLDALGPISIPGQMDSSLKSSFAGEDSLLNEEPDQSTWRAEQDNVSRTSALEDVDRLTAMAGEIDKQRDQEAHADADEEQDLFTQLEADEAPDKESVSEQTTPAQPEPEEEAPQASASSASAQGMQIDDAVPYALRQDLLKQTRPARHWSATVLYAVVALALVSALLGQVVVFRGTELAHTWPQLRPAISTVCDRLPCYYAGPRDVSRISLVNRDVRSHPNAQNALLISATLINDADFKQPYPEILITLSDLSGTVVAKRRFRPAEYLDRLYNRFALMEPQTPVHIDIAVLDPGDDAVNFEFEFM